MVAEILHGGGSTAVMVAKGYSMEVQYQWAKNLSRVVAVMNLVLVKFCRSIAILNKSSLFVSVSSSLAAKSLSWNRKKESKYHLDFDLYTVLAQLPRTQKSCL